MEYETPKTKNRPLHFAARHGHFDAVKLLINSGAKRKAYNTAGSTAAIMANRQKFHTLAEYIDPNTKNMLVVAERKIIESGPLLGHWRERRTRGEIEFIFRTDRSITLVKDTGHELEGKWKQLGKNEAIMIFGKTIGDEMQFTYEISGDDLLMLPKGKTERRFVRIGGR